MERRCTLESYAICAVVSFWTNSLFADPVDLRNWGMETYTETQRTLRIPGTNLFGETASLDGGISGGLNGRAYVWPEATQFRALNSLTQSFPVTYGTQLRSFSDELYAAYWNNGYRSGAGGGDRFYDDNAHVTVALMEAYRLTLDGTYLDRAKQAYSFVKQGEDSVAGGGIYFKQADFSSKDAISTLQGARSATMLYLSTGQQSYLTDATRLLTWAETHIQLADGLYYQRWSVATNGPSGVELVNAAGIAISLNLELYDATGSSHYLSEAQRIATRSLSRYFDAGTGRINDEGYWAFELVDAFDNLYLHDRNSLWLNKAETALTWLHTNKRDPNGHYGLFWGRNGAQVGALASWNLNEQAAVTRAYLYTSMIPEPSAAALLLISASVGLCRRRHSRPEKRSPDLVAEPDCRGRIQHPHPATRLFLETS